MKPSGKIFFALIFTAFSTPAVVGQQLMEITLDAIYRKGELTPYVPEGLVSMNDGEHYTILNRNHIDCYSYRTGELENVYFDASVFPELGLVSAYAFSGDESRILLETARESIYRRSYRADYYIYEPGTGRIESLTENGKVQLGTFSPDGNKVAFVRNNNLYIRDLKEDAEQQITFDGERNHVINGAPDWVYEEEFCFSNGFRWSPDGTQIAFYRFDEGRVREFEMTIFGSLYPETYRYKYPKAGEMNSLVTILVYDLASGKTITLDTGTETDQYIPRIQWTWDPGVLSILRLNRRQNKLEVLHADTQSGESRVVYTEEEDKYIYTVSDQTVTYLPGGERFLLYSEMSGYLQFYLFNYKTGKLQPVTGGQYDVDEFLGYDEKQDLIYYTSCEVSPMERHIYSIRSDGMKKEKISDQPGTNTAAFSKSFRYYIQTHSTINSPPVVTLHNQRGKQIHILEDNEGIKSRMKMYGFSDAGFLTVPTAGGQDLNAWMLKPADFDPDKKYPLFMYVYGGPDSQKVLDKWDDRMPWFQMLAQKGYIVACVDNRGTDGRGEEFRKSTYLSLGQLETMDQVEAARGFGSLEYIDETRIGIFGWSYGGFMTSLCMTRGKGTFAMGIAVAPVTSWRYYDSVYAERYMRKPSENPDGYDRNSPLNYAAGLQGAFLLIHGTADDNVHFQNTMDFTDALVEADRQFEMQIYPNKNHSIQGGNTTYHLYTRMTDFILDKL